jgi:ATP-dependent DNA helicase RecQ
MIVTSHIMRQLSHGQEVEQREVLEELDSESEVELDQADDAADLCNEWRAVYKVGQNMSERKGRKKKDGNKLEPAMDDLINAGSGNGRFSCFHDPLTLYFGNDKIRQYRPFSISHPELSLIELITESDHHDCQSDLPDGCPRCIVRKLAVCCELCSPDFFKNFACVDMEKTKVLASRSRIKDYTAGPSDMNLRDALHNFRREVVRTKFGLACLKDMGPGVFMSNEVLQRVVDCAHEYKIETKDDLAKETRWTGVHNHAADVIALIKTHRPKPLPTPLLTSTPLRPHLSSLKSCLSARAPRSPVNVRSVDLSHIFVSKPSNVTIIS